MRFSEINSKQTRRKWLRTVAATGIATSAVGSISAATAGRRGDFETVIDMVDAGADPTGKELVDPVIAENAGDDTLLRFPTGKYKLGSVVLNDYTNLGLAAAENANARFVATQATDEMLLFRGGSDVLLEGFTFDQRDSDVGGTVGVETDGEFEMRNIHKRGTHPRTPDGGGTAGFRVSVGNADATGVLENCRAPDGDERVDIGAVGTFVPTRHAGTLEFRDCHLEGFTNNGLYGSAPGNYGQNGSIHVRGGLYKNNNISGIRLASAGSSIEGATIVNDRSVSFEYVTNRRGIWMRIPEGENRVEDVDVIQKFRDTPYGTPLLIAQPKGGGVVTDVRIRNDSDAPAIRIGGENPGWTGSDIDLTGQGDLSYPESFTDVCSGSGCTPPTKQ